MENSSKLKRKRNDSEIDTKEVIGTSKDTEGLEKKRKISKDSLEDLDLSQYLNPVDVVGNIKDNFLHSKLYDIKHPQTRSSTGRRIYFGFDTKTSGYCSRFKFGDLTLPLYSNFGIYRNVNKDTGKYERTGSLTFSVREGDDILDVSDEIKDYYMDLVRKNASMIQGELKKKKSVREKKECIRNHYNLAKQQSHQQSFFKWEYDDEEKKMMRSFTKHNKLVKVTDTENGTFRSINIGISFTGKYATKFFVIDAIKDKRVRYERKKTYLDSGSKRNVCLPFEEVEKRFLCKNLKDKSTYKKLYFTAKVSFSGLTFTNMGYGGKYRAEEIYILSEKLTKKNLEPDYEEYSSSDEELDNKSVDKYNGENLDDDNFDDFDSIENQKKNSNANADSSGIKS